jgi:hypothetical protein
MVMVLLAALLLTTASGLALYGADQQAGPLAQWMAGAVWANPDWLEETHEILASLTVILVIFHVAGVTLDSLLHRENLVKATDTHGARRLAGKSHRLSSRRGRLPREAVSYRGAGGTHPGVDPPRQRPRRAAATRGRPHAR